MLRLALSSILSFLAFSLPVASSAGTLAFFETSAGAGNTLNTGPVTDLLIDVDYDAASAEGGGLFGFAEITFQTTGDVIFSGAPTCQAASCFFNASANSIALSGGDAGLGEFGAIFDLLTVTITGTLGTVELTSGTYVDGSFAVQDAPTTVIAQVGPPVPEPTTAVLLAFGLLGLAASRR